MNVSESMLTYRTEVKEVYWALELNMASADKELNKAKILYILIFQEKTCGATSFKKGLNKYE